MTLSNEVECDEAYVIAGHKGQPEVVKNKGRKGRRRRLKGKAGRGTLEKERPPIFGMIQRGGQVVINMIANVNKRPSSRSSKRPLLLVHLFIQMNTAFMHVCVSGDTTISVSTMDEASTPEMKMAMAFVKSM